MLDYFLTFEEKTLDKRNEVLVKDSGNTMDEAHNQLINLK